MRATPFTVLVILCLAPTAIAAPIDMSTWTSRGFPFSFAGSLPSWSLQSGGTAVHVIDNARGYGLWTGDVESLDRRLQFTIHPQIAADFDSIGFALGFNANEASDPNRDFLLLNWTGVDLSNPVPGRGMILLRIKGDDSPFPGIVADHINQVQDQPVGTTIGTATVLGKSTTVGPWSSATPFAFDVYYTAHNVTIFVDDSLALDVNAPSTMPFSSGGFAFSNASQAGVTYRDLTITTEFIPTPSAALLGFPLLGLIGVSRPRRQR